MWHVSIAPQIPLSDRALLSAVERVLDGVGDPELGQWIERTDRALHLRRRLSHDEAAQVGPVVDVRGTWEARKRISRVAHLLPPGWEE